MLFGLAETRWPLSKQWVSPRLFLVMQARGPEACQAYRWTQIAGQSGILSIPRLYFWSFRLTERSSSHTLVWLMLCLCPFRQLRSECPRSILSWPAPPLSYHLSRWEGFYHELALFAAWEWGYLSATCFWRFWPVLVSPGPQVAFPPRSLFLLELSLAVMSRRSKKKKKLKCHLGADARYTRTKWSGSEKKEKKTVNTHTILNARAHTHTRAHTYTSTQAHTHTHTLCPTVCMAVCTYVPFVYIMDASTVHI